MLDVKLLRENLDQVKARMATRGGEVDWDEFVALDRERREALANIERLKEKKNRLSGEIGKLKKSGARCERADARRRRGERSDSQRRRPLAEIEAQVRALHADSAESAASERYDRQERKR